MPPQENRQTQLRPYDNSLEERNTMYDKQTYKKDPELCCTDKVRLFSGNIYKSYSVNYQCDTPYPVKTHDERTKLQLDNINKKAQSSDDTAALENE